MIKRGAALLLFLNFSVAYSQTIKTDVLVIGGTASGVAAAIQCARSKVKTIIIDPNSQLCSNLNVNSMVTIDADRNLPSGIWGEFRSRVREHYKKVQGYDDSTLLKVEPNTAAVIISGMADTVKNLSIKLGTEFVSIKKDDDRWEVVVKENGKTETIKPRVVIDATENGDVLKKANTWLPGGWFVDVNDKDKWYRTSIASGGIEITHPAGPSAMDVKIGGFRAYTLHCFLPIQAVIAKGADNLFASEAPAQATKGIEDLPMQFAAGQGVGVTAAYCAFFKTTTTNLKVRIIQGELLDFKGYMLPLANINGDPYWRAIQQVYATGLLKGKSKMIDGRQQFVFMPDSIATTAEVKPVLTEIYSRAFLWFNKEKPGKEFTVGNLLSFISELTLTDPDNLQRKIEKEWSAQYKFTSDLPHYPSRVCYFANKYLNPFGRAVDLDGRVVN